MGHIYTRNCTHQPAQYTIMIGTNKENDVNSASDSTSSKYSSCAWKTREETMEMLSINKQAIEKHHCVVVCCKKFIRIIRTIRTMYQHLYTFNEHTRSSRISRHRFSFLSEAHALVRSRVHKINEIENEREEKEKESLKSNGLMSFRF